jgi:hypothetical protein
LFDVVAVVDVKEVAEGGDFLVLVAGDFSVNDEND